MIAAEADFAALSKRLTSRAAALAAARAARRRLPASHGWRRADLIWPLFAKG